MNKEDYRIKKKGDKEFWYDQNDELVKEIHYKNGQKEFEQYWLNGQRHREDGPARKSWYENGQKKHESYVLNNQYHREDGPAIQSWYENGQKKLESYYLNDQRHRKDGPSIQWWNKNGQKQYEEYYLNGKELTKEEFEERTDNKDNISKTISNPIKYYTKESKLNYLDNFNSFIK